MSRAKYVGPVDALADALAEQAGQPYHSLFRAGKRGDLVRVGFLRRARELADALEERGCEVFRAKRPGPRRNAAGKVTFNKVDEGVYQAWRGGDQVGIIFRRHGVWPRLESKYACRISTDGGSFKVRLTSTLSDAKQKFRLELGEELRPNCRRWPRCDCAARGVAARDCPAPEGQP